VCVARNSSEKKKLRLVQKFVRKHDQNTPSALGVVLCPAPVGAVLRSGRGLFVAGGGARGRSAPRDKMRVRGVGNEEIWYWK